MMIITIIVTVLDHHRWHHHYYHHHHHYLCYFYHHTKSHCIIIHISTSNSITLDIFHHHNSHPSSSWTFIDKRYNRHGYRGNSILPILTIINTIIITLSLRAKGTPELLMRAIEIKQLGRSLDRVDHYGQQWDDQDGQYGKQAFGSSVMILVTDDGKPTMMMMETVIARI